MWEIRSIDLGARAVFVATLRFYIRACNEKGERRRCPTAKQKILESRTFRAALRTVSSTFVKKRVPLKE